MLVLLPHVAFLFILMPLAYMSLGNKTLLRNLTFISPIRQPSVLWVLLHPSLESRGSSLCHLCPLRRILTRPYLSLPTAEYLQRFSPNIVNCHKILCCDTANAGLKLPKVLSSAPFPPPQPLRYHMRMQPMLHCSMIQRTRASQRQLRLMYIQRL